MNRLEEMQYTKASKLRRKVLFGELFSAQLAAWKARTGKLERDFAASVGVSKNVITKWKQGERIPQGANLAKICKEFGVENDFFDPFDDFGEDFLFNTRAEAMSAKLQRYAQKNGLDDDFYNKLIKIEGFIRLFPFHTPGFNNELNVSEDDHLNDFPQVKYEFRDSKGLRKILTEEDIDFIIRIQKRFGSEILELFRLEKEKIKNDRLNELIEWNLKHYDLSREEVNERLYSVDFMEDEPELSEGKIRTVFNELAALHNIKPHISKSEIAAECDGFDRDIDTDEEYRNRIIQYLRHEGLSEQEISNRLESMKHDKTFFQNYIERYIRMGFIIDEK